MKKLFAFVLGLLLFFCPFAVQAEDIELMPQEEIAEAPAEDIYKVRTFIKALFLGKAAKL